MYSRVTLQRSGRVSPWGSLPAPSRPLRLVESPRSSTTSIANGFAYGTLPGHPEKGEESFRVEHREPGVVFRILAMSRPAGVLATYGSSRVESQSRSALWRERHRGTCRLSLSGRRRMPNPEPRPNARQRTPNVICLKRLSTMWRAASSQVGHLTDTTFQGRSPCAKMV